MGTIFIAITHYKTLNAEDLGHFIDIAPVIDRLLLRTPMDSGELKQFINGLLDKGFPKQKLIIHSDVSVLEAFHLTAIHFKEDDPLAYAYKAKYPEVTVSMSTHSVESIRKARSHGLDYVHFGHVFESASKKGVPPRSREETERATEMDMPVMAIGGINHYTIDSLPDGFSGICAISLFMDQSIEEIKAVRRMWCKDV
ncbi:thiamine phosphate synthase [Salinicoccus sp. CNSTN-B1]